MSTTPSSAATTSATNSTTTSSTTSTSQRSTNSTGSSTPNVGGVTNTPAPHVTSGSSTWTITNAPTTISPGNASTTITSAPTPNVTSNTTAGNFTGNTPTNTSATTLPLTTNTSPASNNGSTNASTSTAVSGRSSTQTTRLPATTRSTSKPSRPLTSTPPGSLTSTSPVSAGSGQCQAPPPITNGVIHTSAPYTPGKAVTYGCSAGFTLTGQATILCQNGQWSTSFPQCLASSSAAQGGNGSGHGGDNNVYVGTSFPLWLAIVLGVTFGVLCLLMLTCLVMFVLRVCGCLKRSLLGDPLTTSSVAPVQGGGQMAPGVAKVNQATAISFIELEPFDDFQTATTGQRPPDDSRFHRPRNGKTGGQNSRPGRFVEEQNNNNNSGWSSPRKKAKKPDTWMPHRQQRRNLNTSTQ